MSLPLLGGGAGTAGPAPTAYATFDGTITNGTLSNGNLTFTHSNGLASTARSLSQKNSGKWYFEITVGTMPGANDCVGVAKSAAVDANLIFSGQHGLLSFQAGGVFSNDASTGLSIGSISTGGTVVCFAIDLDNDKGWIRNGAGGNWLGQVIGSQNPATNTGGGSLSNYSATTMAPFVGFDTIVGGAYTANFGASAFSGTPPSGFTAGWTA